MLQLFYINEKKNYKNNLWKIDLLDYFKVSLLIFNFAMIYIIYKVLLLLKNHLNYLKDNIFECFFKKYNRLFIIIIIIIINIIISNVITYNDDHEKFENSRSEEENIIKDLLKIIKDI